MPSGVKGVRLGRVIDNCDPQGLGRVKVSFEWREREQESDWARIAVLMAGRERGTFFLPEVDDEVLVAFEHGDVRRPFVLGALWNGRDTPPETNESGDNDIRKIRSRSGHEILFNDDAKGGREKIEIRSASGHAIVLDDSSGSEKIEIVDQTSSNRIVIDSNGGTIALESAGRLEIRSPAIEIEADATIDLKSGGTLTLQGALVKIN